MKRAETRWHTTAPTRHRPATVPSEHLPHAQSRVRKGSGWTQCGCWPAPFACRWRPCLVQRGRCMRWMSRQGRSSGRSILRCRAASTCPRTCACATPSRSVCKSAHSAACRTCGCKGPTAPATRCACRGLRVHQFVPLQPAPVQYLKLLRPVRADQQRPRVTAAGAVVVDRGWRQCVDQGQFSQGLRRWPSSRFVS